MKVHFFAIPLLLCGCQMQATSHACPVLPNWTVEDQIALRQEHHLVEGKDIRQDGGNYALYLCDTKAKGKGHNCVAAEMPLTLRVVREWVSLRDESRACAGQD